MSLRLLGRAGAVAAVLASPLAAKPPELPARPAVDGTVPTPAEQDYFRPAALPGSKPPTAGGQLPAPVKYAPPTAGALATTLMAYDGPRPADAGQTGARPAPAPAGAAQTEEPPFAVKEATAEVAALQLAVLREAARQYRAAVAGGDKTLIAETGRTLDAVLKHTKSD